jgi:hypothetical protein
MRIRPVCPATTCCTAGYPSTLPENPPGLSAELHNTTPRFSLVAFCVSPLLWSSHHLSAPAISLPLTESRIRSKAARSLTAGPAKVCGLETKFAVHTHNPATAPVSNLDLPRIDHTTDQALIHLAIRSHLGNANALIGCGLESFPVCQDSDVPE